MKNRMKTKSLFFLFLLTLILTVNFYSQGSDGKTYVDKKNGFSISYPADFKVLAGAKAASETAFGDPGKGAKLIKVTPLRIPEKYHGEYEFNIWVSKYPKDKCGAPDSDANDEVVLEPPPEGLPKTRTIDGNTFYAYSGSDGGMSKSLGLAGYRGMVNKSCWQIQSVTYQVSAFDDFKSFNDKIIDKAFEQFVNSFRFIEGK